VRKALSKLKFLIPSFALIVALSFFLITSVQAATLAAVYVFLSRIKVNLAGTAGNEVQMILAIDTASAVASGGTITIEFPDDEDTLWCRTAGALTVASVTESAVDLSGQNWDIDSGLPNSGTALAASCTQGGAGTVDTITISNVGALSAGTTYGVQISNGTAAGVLGTDDTAGEHILTISARESGVPIDSKSFKIYLVTDDVVIISATVSDIPSVVCNISSNSVNLGTLYAGGAYATGTHTISTSTTANGYYWAVYGTGDSSTDAGLWNGTTLIQSGATATLDLTSASISGFGMTLSDPDAAESATVTANFVDTTAGTFGTIDRLYSGAKMVLYQNGGQASAEQSTVTYGAKAQAAATSGSYTEYVYFVCGGYY
jgi:hypothetical protein